ncbi:hypothetical protein ACUHMQ_20050 [Chitinimonas sp. PSY-7]|uniref:hypothetical protein n=1 Tax=Chitinimonas sp. PSY-7 TaxID=3459088 RepID=UPI0040400980
MDKNTFETGGLPLFLDLFSVSVPGWKGLNCCRWLIGDALAIVEIKLGLAGDCSSVNIAVLVGGLAGTSTLASILGALAAPLTGLSENSSTG